jgi:HSP90 family molecular chaperone
MDQLQFRVSAELKNILGRDLITSDNIAVLELVKNSYDAHATKVEITFGNDSIVIADNGKGMSAADISDKWLFIAYSAKSDGTEDDNYRSKIRRDFAGAKGIGRLSCDRLARYLTMNTVSEETDTLEILKVDWAKFENRQKENIDTIPVEHESTNGNYVFPDNSSHGTQVFRENDSSSYRNR